LTEGKSFGNTSALLTMSESCHLTKKAIYTRLCHSAEWLRWLCENLCRESRKLYRFRWQIELVFKRLKSLFGYNQIPSKIEASAKAWFYGKLLLAAFCERWANKACFSP
jgi:hypothetical protein